MKRLTIESLGGEVGCRQLAEAFYARVAKDPVLKPLFPGKSVRCANEEFASFLVQFLDGDSTDYQYRWWVSLRESHSRFRVSEAQRARWVELMHATLDGLLAEPQDWKQLFLEVSFYVIGVEREAPEMAEWGQQLSLDRLIDHIIQGRDAEAIALARQHKNRPGVFVGVLARMILAGRAELVEFALDSLRENGEVRTWRFNGRTLLHFSAAAGCVPVVRFILDSGVDPNIPDNLGHASLYSAANGCDSAEVVSALLDAGADVNHCGGSSKSTALHAAARRGHLAVTAALLDAGAAIGSRDKKGQTPLDRAKNLRRGDVVDLLEARG